jgi:hypothetical protein
MKKNKFLENQEPAAPSLPVAAAHSNQNDAVLKPVPDEVAKRAYLNYVNQGSQDGRDMHHWLEAEAQLAAERSLSRVYLFSTWGMK